MIDVPLSPFSPEADLMASRRHTIKMAGNYGGGLGAVFGSSLGICFRNPVVFSVAGVAGYNVGRIVGKGIAKKAYDIKYSRKRVKRLCRLI